MAAERGGRWIILGRGGLQLSSVLLTSPDPEGILEFSPAFKRSKEEAKKHQAGICLEYWRKNKEWVQPRDNEYRRVRQAALKEAPERHEEYKSFERDRSARRKVEAVEKGTQDKRVQANNVASQNYRMNRKEREKRYPGLADAGDEFRRVQQRHSKAPTYGGKDSSRGRLFV